MYHIGWLSPHRSPETTKNDENVVKLVIFSIFEPLNWPNMDYFSIYLVNLCYYRLNILESSNFNVLWAIFSHFVSRYTSKMLKMAFFPLPRHAFWPLKWARVGIFWIFWARYIRNWKIYNFWNVHPNEPKPAIFFRPSKLKVQKWGPLTL